MYLLLHLVIFPLLMMVLVVIESWQEGGWPLGLQPLNLRIDLVRNVDFSGSLSLSTLISTTSPTSSYSSSSSELDTQVRLINFTTQNNCSSFSPSLVCFWCGRLICQIDVGHFVTTVPSYIFLVAVHCRILLP